MNRIAISLLISLVILGLFPAATPAEMTADYDSVRLMLTAPDNQRFDHWDQESLIKVLVDIVTNDPEDAMYHDRVVSGALKVLGSMNVPEAIPLLINNLDTYTTTCLFWLGTYADPDAVSAIVGYLGDDDPSVRYEAAAALGTIPIVETAPGVEVDVDEELISEIELAVDALNARLEVETDTAVVEALTGALEHLS